MKSKTRRRLNMVVSHLRQAQDLLGGINLADGLPLFDACKRQYAMLDAAIVGLAPPPKEIQPCSPTS